MEDTYTAPDEKTPGYGATKATCSFRTGSTASAPAAATIATMAPSMLATLELIDAIDQSSREGRRIECRIGRRLTRPVAAAYRGGEFGGCLSLTHWMITRGDSIVHWQRFFQTVAMVSALVVIAATAVAQVVEIKAYGRPKNAGHNRGPHYAVWYDEEGWHVRSETADKTHRFEGTIEVEGGKIAKVLNFESFETSKKKKKGNRPDYGRVTDKRIQFHMTTADKGDGFGFRVSDATTKVRFRLLIDGDVRPDRVSTSAPPANPPPAGPLNSKLTPGPEPHSLDSRHSWFLPALPPHLTMPRLHTFATPSLHTFATPSLHTFALFLLFHPLFGLRRRLAAVSRPRFPRRRPSARAVAADRHRPENVLWNTELPPRPFHAGHRGRQTLPHRRPRQEHLRNHCPRHRGRAGINLAR